MVKRGRPPKSEQGPKSAVFSVRMRPDLRNALDRAAAKAGHPVSEEIVKRLKKSFQDDQRLEDNFGDRQLYQLMRMAAQGMQFDSEGKPLDWKKNYSDFLAGFRAVTLILGAIAPVDRESPLPNADDERFEDDVELFVQRRKQLREEAHLRARSSAAAIWEAVHAAEPDLPLNQGTRKDHQNSVIRQDLEDIYAAWVWMIRFADKDYNP